MTGIREGRLACLALDRPDPLPTGVFSTGLFGINEDQYVVESALQTALAREDPSKELIIAWKGCGKMWRYNPRSNNGTLAKPKGTGPDRLSCDHVHRHGGVCGGTGPHDFLSFPPSLPPPLSLSTCSFGFMCRSEGRGGEGEGGAGGSRALLSRANIENQTFKLMRFGGCTLSFADAGNSLLNVPLHSTPMLLAGFACRTRRRGVVPRRHHPALPGRRPAEHRRVHGQLLKDHAG